MVANDGPQQRQPVLGKPLLLAVDELVADDLGTAVGEGLPTVPDRLTAQVEVLPHLVEVDVVPNMVAPVWTGEADVRKQLVASENGQGFRIGT